MIRTLILAALVAVPAFAQDARMEGDRVAQRTKTLMSSIEWGSSRVELQQAAKEQGKLVFWLQLVGKLDDGL